ncbi:ketopantoate reductase family protein [Colwelliaceae bacterium 6441]
MHFVILGSGAVGGYFGARLADSGQQVTFVARNEQLKCMQAQGLKVESINGDIFLPKVSVTDNLQHIENVDVVFIAVKSFHLTSILTSLTTIVSKNTRFIPLLNGVDAIEKLLASGLNDKQVYGGLAKIISSVKSPGVISHTGAEPHISLGLLASQQADLTEQKTINQIAQCLKCANISVRITTNIDLALWRKFIFVAAWGALASYEQKSIGELRQNKATKDKLSAIVHEYALIANSLKINITNEIVNETLRYLSLLPERSQTSMQRDITQQRCSEFNVLVEYPYQLAKEKNLNTPLLDICFEKLQMRIKQ